MVASTLMIRADDPAMQGNVFALYHYVLLLVLKSAGVTREAAAEWSLEDYVKYMMTGTLWCHPPSTKPCQVPGSCVRPQNEEKKLPLARSVFTIAGVVAGLILTNAYVQSFQPFMDDDGKQRLFANLTDWRAHLDLLAYGSMVYFVMLFGQLPSRLLFQYWFGCHIPLAMDSPYMATSFSEFWMRWNTPVQP
ncbi:hypothetical protein DFJ73DRAFT_311302 [Zopfochytrium polystomum]|nr:hypothetical protein DFJ73DRAFT_311302 [Zopfochytrium polystomum]